MQLERPARGPLVWRDLDQQALDDAYDQLVYAPNRDQILKRRIANSALARDRLGEPRRMSYGPTAIEALDIFCAPKPNTPVNIFIHGGAWRRNRAADYAVQAELFVRAGAHHVLLDFCNVDDTGGDLTPMAEQVRRAVAWVYRNAAGFGGDPDRLYLSAHSSGAHLAGCVVTTD
jgi:arylformamidase